MGAPAYAKRGKVRPIKASEQGAGAIRWLPSKRVRYRTVPHRFRACGKLVEMCRVSAGYPALRRLAALALPGGRALGAAFPLIQLPDRRLASP